MPTILIVDDEPNITEVLEIALRDEEMDVFKSASGRQALDVLREKDVDLVISDIRMPDLSGVELLREAKQIAPDVGFIMITAFASTETAIEALQHGAYDYIIKPFRMEELRSIVRRALRKMSNPKAQPAASSMDTEAQQSQKLFQALHSSHVVGKSPRMVEVYKIIGTVAMGESTILITGESGTGKELVAR